VTFERKDLGTNNHRVAFKVNTGTELLRRLTRPRPLRLLTVLRDEGDAAVHDDGDIVSAHLLLPQSVSFPAGRPLDVRVPQREIGPPNTLQVESSDGPHDEDDQHLWNMN